MAPLHLLDSIAPAVRPSSGPITAEGKSASRLNALKSGLSGRGLILPEREAEMARVRKVHLREAFGTDPGDAWSEILIETIAVESVRAERCRQEEGLIRERAVTESTVLWVENRTLDAIMLGQKLALDPETVRIEMEKSRFGIEWMIGRWAILNLALEKRGTWTVEEENLSLHLLGTPAMLRESMRNTPPDGLKAIIDREMARLLDLRASRIVLDDDERDLAEVGISPDAEKRLRTVRRYETASRRAMEKAREELRRHLEESAARTSSPEACDSSGAPETSDYETNPTADESSDLIPAQSEGDTHEPEPASPTNPVLTPFRHTPTLPMNRKQRRARQARLRRA